MMRMPDEHHAMDCTTKPKDWATLGARILSAAAMATAVHMAEQAGRIAYENTELAVVVTEADE